MTQRNTNNWNSQIIEEFRANGGMFANANMLLLTTTGAKSGQRRTNPLGYLADGDRLFVFATKRGAPTNPDWYHNLLAHPDVTVEVGTETFAATATVLQGEERDRIYARQAALVPMFADYQTRTDRIIPVVALTRRTG